VWMMFERNSARYDDVGSIVLTMTGVAGCMTSYDYLGAGDSVVLQKRPSPEGRTESSCTKEEWYNVRSNSATNESVVYILTRRDGLARP
jgi:hypothetical protein